MLELVRKANKHWIVTGILFSLGGVLMHLAVESWTKALMIVVGAAMIDVAIDLAFTKAEEKAGEID